MTNSLATPDNSSQPLLGGQRRRLTGRLLNNPCRCGGLAELLAMIIGCRVFR
jgi:hypothetical protein